MMAIRELKRITRGPIVFSFFNSFSLSAMVRFVKNAVKNHIPTDRIPIRKKIIVAELESVGLEVIKIIPALLGVSPMCIVVAKASKN
jgi:hypothetical protein